MNKINLKRGFSIVEILITLILLAVFTAVSFVWLDYNANKDYTDYFKNNFYWCSSLLYESNQASNGTHKIICYKNVPSSDNTRINKVPYNLQYKQEVDILWLYNGINRNLQDKELFVNGWAIYSTDASWNPTKILYLPY